MSQSFLVGLAIGFVLGLVSEVVVKYFRSRDDDDDDSR
jgi:NhaP-type Na+/H+ or K+/H+ antiporter